MKKEDLLDEQGCWNCTKCGACCHFVSDLLPEYDRGDGVCINLSSTNECLIYDARPDICKVGPVSNHPEMAEACLTLQEIVDAGLAKRVQTKGKLQKSTL